MKDIPVLYSDDSILVVNKPAGLAVQGGEGVTVTVIDVLERQTGGKIYPVHRLDKDTAGILVVARTSAAAAEYCRHIESGSLVKGYRAICFNVPTESSGTIKLPAGRSGNEKPAETRWKVEAAHNGYAALQLELGTGRMHQIRIHLASIGCPILADDKYGDFKRNRTVRTEFGVRKLQLCAASLMLPVGNSVRLFTVNLPEHMSECATALSLECSP